MEIQRNMITTKALRIKFIRVERKKENEKKTLPHHPQVLYRSNNILDISVNALVLEDNMTLSKTVFRPKSKRPNMSNRMELIYNNVKNKCHQVTTLMSL